VLTGSTTNLSELHVYLATLEHQPLFAKVELVSIEAGAAGSNQSQFVARIVVKPPHGNVVTNVVLSLRERKPGSNATQSYESTTARTTQSTAGLQDQTVWYVNSLNHAHFLSRSEKTTLREPGSCT
jgi:hypothetical protein